MRGKEVLAFYLDNWEILDLIFTNSWLSREEWLEILAKKSKNPKETFEKMLKFGLLKSKDRVFRVDRASPAWLAGAVIATCLGERLRSTALIDFFLDCLTWVAEPADWVEVLERIEQAIVKRVDRSTMDSIRVWHLKKTFKLLRDLETGFV